MRIAVVTPWFPDDDGAGPGQFVLKEVQALREYGEDARVIHLDVNVPSGKTVRSVVKGIPIVRLGIHVRNPLHFALYRRRLLAAIQFADVIHSHAVSSLLPVSCVSMRRPWVHSEHWSALTTPESLPKVFRSVVPVVAQLERLPDVVIGESERLNKVLQRVRGSKRVALVPCIVPSPEVVVPLPERGPKMKLVSTGGLIPRKAPLLAIETLKVLAEKGQPASLRWIGEGPLRDECRRLAEKLGVEVELLGFQPYEVVQSEISASDLFFAPTQGENFFVAAAEALVNGRPLCASNRGGHTEYAPEPYSEIVGEQSANAYAEALMRLADKTAHASAKDISASVADKFSPTTVAALLRDIYVAL